MLLSSRKTFIEPSVLWLKLFEKCFFSAWNALFLIMLNPGGLYNSNCSAYKAKSTAAYINQKVVYIGCLPVSQVSA